MFTGIIEEIGTVLSISTNSIRIQAETVLEEIKAGDSVAVNGVCLTVTKIDYNSFNADISPETMRVTAFKNLKISDLVNLERAMPANGRFGGHIVSGHVDGIGKIISVRKNKEFYDLCVETDKNNTKYIVKKGSVTINGISLTVANINENIIQTAIIPHTFENTSLKHAKSGDLVNIETDILAKYIEKFLLTSDNKTGISLEFLQENGF